MHKPEEASKIATVIGLVFDGIGMFGMLAVAAAVNVAEVFTVDLFLDEGLTQSEAELMVDILDVLGVVFFVAGGIFLIVFMVNIVLFTKLINGRFNAEKASKTYLYQIVWGAINLLFNQISGIAHLISGIKGRSTKLQSNRFEEE
ncbi:MAG: hypothetical protein ACLFUQ_01550 [Candidatus Izemoplasmataceae bacterium]